MGGCAGGKGVCSSRIHLFIPVPVPVLVPVPSYGGVLTYSVHTYIVMLVPPSFPTPDHTVYSYCEYIPRRALGGVGEGPMYYKSSPVQSSPLLDSTQL